MERENEFELDWGAVVADDDAGFPVFEDESLFVRNKPL